MKLQIISGLIALLLIILSYNAEASIGYTFDGTDTHIWNEGNIEPNYYYSGVCNAQLSNQPNEQWEKVKVGVTYGSTVQDKINNYVELNTGGCSRIEDTDSSSYVNITAYKTVSLAGKSGILAQNEYIELNDDMMTRTYQFKSNDNINTDVWFVIKRTNIDISANGKDDFLKVYNLDGSENYLNLTKADENNLTVIRDNTEILPSLHLLDYYTNENIMFSANTNADFKFIINDDDIYLMVKAGTFTIGQSKQLETKWIDAGCSCLPSVINVGTNMVNVPLTATTGTSNLIGAFVNYQGGGGCVGSDLIWQDNSTGSFTTIPAVDTDLDCNGDVTCKVTTPQDGVTYNKTIDWEGAGQHFMRSYWQCTGVAFSPRASPTYNTTVTEALVYSTNYYISHSNINFGNSYNESTNYLTDYSLITQPLGQAQSANYIISEGFYHRFPEFIKLIVTPIFWVWLAGVVFSVMLIRTDKKKESDGIRKRLIGSVCLVLMGLLTFYVTNSMIGGVFTFISLIILGFTLKEL